MAKPRSTHTPVSAPEKKDINLSGAVLDKLKTSFDSFDKIDEAKRIDLYGDKDLILQFREHFKKTNPNLLDQIDQKDLPVYLQSLEKKWFKLGNLKEESKILKEEIWESESEITVIKSSLGKLKDFCDVPINKIPPHIFSDFATEAGFSTTPLNIDSTSNIRSVDDLWKRWKRFAETKHVTVDGQTLRLKDFHTDDISAILCPDYNPTERIVVQIAIEKIRKVLPAPLKADFDVMFPLPIDAHSMMISLDVFKTSWQVFLDTHEAQIDEPLRKKLDDTIVTNWDIKNAFIRSGHDFDDSVSFSHWEKRFRRVFNKLATRQLFEEVRSTSAAVEKYVDNITDAFVQFPPYVNQVFSKYPYNPRNISTVDTEFDKDIVKFDSQLNSLEAQIAAETDKEKKKDFKKKKSELKKQKEMRKRQAYTKWLESKNSKLSSVIAKLAQNNFDFNKLDSVQQQEIINILVQSKLDDLTKNKVPELLKIDQADFSKFVKDLFDLNKKQILIPTKTGNYPINFKSKSFISSDLSSFFSIDKLDQLDNLPLNFEVDVNESNRDFFEKSPLFKHLFQDFDSKSWTKKISDGYKIRVKKWEKGSEWYLSPYPPINMDELEKNWKFKNKKNDNAEDKEDKSIDKSDYMFLYSSPISSADQNRDLVVDENWNPVFFPKNKEGDYDIEILDSKLNISGNNINSFLMAYVLGQESMDRDLSVQTEKEIGEKLKKLDDGKWFKDVVNADANSDSESSDEKKEDKEKKEKSDYEKCINERDKIWWYKFPASPNTSPDKIDPKWFVEGSSFLMSFGSSLLPPWTGDKYIRAEIIKIDKWTGKFTLKFVWWEAKLGKYEWHKQEFALSADGMNKFKDMFSDSKIYKLPDTKKYKWKIDNYIDILAQSWVDPSKSFWNIKWKWDRFQFTVGDYIGQDVEYFGRYEPSLWEVDSEKWNMYLYKIKHNPNGTINVSSQFKDGKENVKYSKDMDYDTFIAFVSSKSLQPKSKEQADTIKKKNYDWTEVWAKDKVPFFSINNIIGFVKNIPGKVKDGIKKYDEEKTEDLTDIIVQKWWLYKKLAAIIPSDRMASAFESMNNDYNADRDNRIWKKIDKRLKIYEWDPHFATQYTKVFSDVISGKVEPKNNYKIAAMLLAMIKKWKWPYNRNAHMVGKWLWIRAVFGPEHQARYLKIREMKQRELQEKGPVYGWQWAWQTSDELVELEMKYMVHVADGRQMSAWNEAETYLANKRSRQFSGKLDEYYNEHYRKSVVEEWYNKVPKTTNFEFARFEYFRLISERPMQAIPYLKVMAEKALTDRDWKIFEKWVVGLMLSGVAQYMVQSDVKWFVQKICRTRWFLPWLWIKDINQQSKLIRLLNIAAWGKFDVNYKIENFSMWNLDKEWVNSTRWIISRVLDYKAWDDVSNFLKFDWKNSKGQTLIDVYNDPKTPPEDKLLLWELIAKWSEKDEEIDQDVKYNAFALTGSVLTKSQSVVDELIRFEWWEFKWKDKDTIQAMQEFWSQVSKSIPKGKENPDSVVFFLKKFENWFGARGFSDNERSIFVRRLAAIKNCTNKKEAEDMLRYTIVGTITARSGSGWVPSQLLAWLDAFKNFFKSNLDTILKPDVVEKTFGIQYKDDINNAYEVWNWSEYVEVADRDLYQSTIFSASPDERKRINEIKKKLSLSQYIHKDLYMLAEKLEKNYGQPNRFKEYSNLWKVDTKKQLSETLVPNHWVRVKNKETLGKLKDILENKDKNAWLSMDDQIAYWMNDMEDFDY